ncbi:MAG: sigma-54 dependent transcriptional regulator [Puniceicoccales bacterium]|jgi:DNA-binding NtrC family response regulator|nr:sigma-54 dependent transcriptional regulator [Puniceicoccales bacterium]
MTPIRILVVDDEKHARDGLAHALQGEYTTTTAASATEAMGILAAAKEPFHLVITDLRMPGKSGIDVAHFCHTLDPEPACIVMTAYGDIATAVNAMKAGAVDFLSKPLDLAVVEATLEQALRQKKVMPTPLFQPSIIGKSDSLRRALDLLHRVAATNVTILLVGETGVGKELFAREIHRLSARAGGPFLAINGAALPEDMVESQLFGHERGAFTDARQRHCGYFERAHGGTLLLDEVGELPTSVQIKLLRVLESKSFERLGGDCSIQVDVRLIAATNADLAMRVRMGDFREDLFYRINVIAIRIPPLRERLDDLELLIESFWRGNIAPPHLSEGALAMLRMQPWPGNVRELRNFCDAMAVLYPKKCVDISHVEAYFSSRGEARPMPSIALPDRRGDPLPDLATDDIKQILWRCNGNHSQAAKMLGISRSTLYRRLREKDA